MINSIKQAFYTATALVLLAVQEIDFNRGSSVAARYWGGYFRSNTALADKGYKTAFKMLFKREA